MMRYRVPAPTVVIVDDQGTGRLVLAEIVRGIDSRINVVSFADPVEALEYVRCQPADLVLTDYLMPRLDGIETTRALRKLYPVEQLPVVMTTIVHSRELLYRAFDAGVSDYLLRPIDPAECRMRCENLLRARSHFQIQQRHIESLASRLDKVKDELRLSEDSALERLIIFNQLHDQQSAKCQHDVALYAGFIASALGCSEEEVELLRVAASVHDIGELALPSGCWTHPGSLSHEQLACLRRHTIVGHDLLASVSSRLMQTAAEIALNHHERLDGSGYPRGLPGKEIPFMARIVAVADVFSALVSVRPYRNAMSPECALACMCEQMRDKLDADAIGVLVNSIEDVCALSPALASGKMAAGIRHG
ncbi:HD domain-containing phosphohydrolase [Lacisediminimonas profundi]|uniref:HD domain-containing phosphohydrolase n=1 Tax=Lacisediminimonas profundi TaxID=2603856 RepID=UPI00124B0AC1|nr:HD domain-containing phosphohydrolase [Lacisediminimonas profundi]